MLTSFVGCIIHLLAIASFVSCQLSGDYSEPPTKTDCAKPKEVAWQL